jgi:copper chaperone CopZ
MAMQVVIVCAARSTSVKAGLASQHPLDVWHFACRAQARLGNWMRTTYILPMTEFAITGMTCNGCRTKVEKTLAALLPDVTVTLQPPRAVTTATVGADQLNAVLEKVGAYRASSLGTSAQPHSASMLSTYYALLLLIGLIALASFAASNWMMAFMGGFFAVFGAFKLLDVPAFANSYAMYDVVAKRFKPWGYAYPFIETALGFAFLFHFQMIAATWAALVLSLVGAIGVIQANLSKQTIQCACLGTVFKLPMSVVTIVENLGMAAMAAYMLWMMA